VPTKTPFDFSNENYCGANYTDAQEHCYKVNKPCPTGAPEVCPGDHQCFGGVTCTAPPSEEPTTSPTPVPTPKNYGPPVSDLSSPGGAPIVDGQGGRPNDMPVEASQSNTKSPVEPFDDSAWGTFPGATASTANKFMSGKIFWSTIIVFAFVGLSI